jgi:hypothetical protein
MSFYTLGTKESPGFIYIGPPKTGSTSARAWAERVYYGTVHKISHADVNHKDFEGLNLPYITMVRNPYDRMVSAYQQCLLMFKDLEGMKFTDFVTYIYLHDFESISPTYKISVKRNMVDYLKKDGKVVDLAITMRFENIKEDWKLIQDFANSDLPVLHHNEAKLKIDYKEIYTPTTKQLVEKIYKDDLEYFNYSF